MVVIFILSHQPKLPQIPGLSCLEQLDWNDKIKHIVGYGVLGVLLWRAIDDRLPFWRKACIVVGVSVLYGMTDEFHQRYVPNRTCDFCDIVADAIGAAGAVALFWTIKLYRSNKDDRRRENSRI